MKFDSTYKLNNGVSIPVIGYGTWRLPNTLETARNVAFAIKQGYRLIDTASIYQNQEMVGKGIKDSGIDRRELFITSKLWNDDQGFESTIKAFNKTIKELGVDYLDLYLIHWPIPMGHLKDYRELNVQTWKAMEQLYSEGKIKAIGLSNFMPEHIDHLMKHTKITPAIDQIELHPGLPCDELLQYAKEHNIIVESWGPLVSGRALADEELLAIANKYHRTIAQLCLRWAIQQGIIPLPKSAHNERIIENSLVFDFTITEEDMKKITKANYQRYGGDPYKEAK